MTDSPPPLRLADKVILVMGGTTGIGSAVVEASLGQGACVVAVGRDEASVGQLEQAHARWKPHLCTLVADATDEHAAADAVRCAVERWGKLDGLVHVAGGSGRKFGDGPLHSIPTEGWQQTLRWNLDSVYYSNRAALRQFLTQRAGAIVNITSVLFSHPSPRYFATHAYTCAKAAIVGLTLAAAAYYAPCNIRVNAVAPGLIDTPMAQRATSDPQVLSYIAHKQPLLGGRAGLPEDVSRAVVFLLSDEARYITGQVIAVDGGWSVTDSGATLSCEEILRTLESNEIRPQ